MKRLVIEGGILGIVLLVIALSYSLGIPQSLVAGGIGFLLLPLADRCRIRARTVEDEFYQVSSYMEQMLCSFRRRPVIGAALQDSQSIFARETKMWRILEKMKSSLQAGELVPEQDFRSGGNLLRDTLGIMEQAYPCRRMKLLHDFIVKAEAMGGNTTESLNILLRDFQMWKRRVRMFQKKRQYLCSDSVAACVTALGLCGLSYHFIPWNLREMLTRSWQYQWSSVVFVSGIMGIFVWILSRQTEHWTDTRERRGEKNSEHLKKSYRGLKKKKVGVLKYFSKRVCRRAVEQEFPYWLLTVALFLQMDNTFQAVRSSVEYTSEIFSSEVNEFLQRIYADPVSPEPYSSFFAELQLPEVQSGMKLLYAFTNNGYEDTSGQIRFLVEQNHLVMDQVEKKEFEDQVAAFGFVRQVPMLMAALKVIMDLVFLLIMTFGKYFLERQVTG